MAGLADIVGVLMQGGLASSSQQRIGNAMGGQGLGQAGGVLGQMLGDGGAGGDLLGSVLGGARDMLGKAGRSVQSGNPATTAGLGALAGALFGGGSGSVKGALGGGAMALLAGLALQALSNRQSGAGAAGQSSGVLPLGLRAPASAQEHQELEHQAELMLKAMINAAKADGSIDGVEMDKIVGKLQEAGADAEIQLTVLEQMRGPLDLESLTREVTSPQLAAQVYAASLFAIEVDTAAERDYLARLATATGLNAGAVQQIHAALGVS